MVDWQDKFSAALRGAYERMLGDGSFDPSRRRFIKQTGAAAGALMLPPGMGGIHEAPDTEASAMFKAFSSMRATLIADTLTTTHYAVGVTDAASGMPVQVNNMRDMIDRALNPVYKTLFPSTERDEILQASLLDHGGTVAGWANAYYRWVIAAEDVMLSMFDAMQKEEGHNLPEIYKKITEHKFLGKLSPAAREEALAVLDAALPEHGARIDEQAIAAMRRTLGEKAVELRLHINERLYAQTGQMLEDTPRSEIDEVRRGLEEKCKKITQEEPGLEVEQKGSYFSDNSFTENEAAAVLNFNVRLPEQAYVNVMADLKVLFPTAEIPLIDDGENVAPELAGKKGALHITPTRMGLRVSIPAPDAFPQYAGLASALVEKARSSTQAETLAR